MTIQTMIAISSGKGGVGKSTVASNFAVALAKTGASVGLMDADITGPNLPLLMGLEGERPRAQDDKMAPLEAHGVRGDQHGVPGGPGKGYHLARPNDPPCHPSVVRDVAWGDLDYMIIDLPPGTGDAQLTLAQTVPISGAVIVTQPQQVALGDARRGITMFQQVDVPIIGIVENMSGDFFGSGGGEQLAVERGSALSGVGAARPAGTHRRGCWDADRRQPPDSGQRQALTSIALDVAKRADELAGDTGDDVIQLRTIGEKDSYKKRRASSKPAVWFLISFPAYSDSLLHESHRAPAKPLPG